MSKVTRRNAIKLAAGAVVAATLPTPAAAVGFLDGTFYVRCSRGHDDKVEGITRNHDCEGRVNGRKCNEKSVDGGTAIVVCPDGHGGPENRVERITRQHQCQTKLPNGGICGKQARRG